MRIGRRARHDEGFTLVELLIVIVILGILSAMTAFAVRAIADRGEAASCATDLRTIQSAQDSYEAQHGVYVSETDLVTAGLLHSESELHDVVLALDDYSIVATGKCLAAGQP